MLPGQNNKNHVKQNDHNDCSCLNHQKSNLPFTAEDSCLVGVPVEDIRGGGGAAGLLMLASVCCFITCLCWIFSISGFSMIALAKLDLLLLMLIP